ncbi:polyunsaturated fatty acid lipoxygenase ALOX15B-like isoform X3 [Camelus bactrianus]|uniref:Polyunsaturated fatty acid lipoxygenase ALOX15B-like isoform X3 n=1 Tax=Camelus bactrianus TaxID=9837 RepID=A0AC58NKN7_CAMBA
MGEYWDVGPVLLLLRVHKTSLALPSPLGSLAPDAWFCHWLQLMPPRGSPLCFPCYQWLEGEGSLVLREGTGGVSFSWGYPTAWMLKTSRSLIPTCVTQSPKKSTRTQHHWDRWAAWSCWPKG